MFGRQNNDSPHSKNARLSREKAFQKIRHFCAYQERCRTEVREKLFALGVWKKDLDEIMSQLIEENYLNEERFARQFAGGKFRVKQWGRIKIRYELKQKQVSEYCIAKALAEIDDVAYEKTFQQLAIKKLKGLKSEKNIFTKKRKVSDYLIQKGYEFELINKLLSSEL